MKESVKLRWLCVLLLAAFFGFASGYQILGLSRDYQNYFSFFDFVRDSPDYWSMEYRFEPGFSILIYWLVSSGLSNVVIYSLIAGCIVFIKYSSIEYGEKYWIVILIFTFYFLARYIILFEMTVLRAACAFSLAFFVFVRKKTDNVKTSDILILTIAILFHYSAIVFFLIYFVQPLNKWKVVVVALATFCVVSLVKKAALFYLPEYLSVFSTYQDFNEATFLPVPLIFDIIFLFFTLWKFENADLAMRYAIYGIAISVALHFSLIEYSLIAGRFRDLLSVFILIYIVRAPICGCIKIQRISLIYVFITGLVYIYLYGFYEPLLS